MGQSTTPLSPPSIALLDRHRGPATELYAATVTVTGGGAAHGRASGVARSDDGVLDLALRLPPELGGPGAGTNPEQLFAAGYAACFHGALMLLARRAGVDADDAEVSVTVSFGRDPVDGLFMLAANVRVSLPGVPTPVAEELIRNAERVCPYAKMARQGIDSVVALASPPSRPSINQRATSIPCISENPTALSKPSTGPGAKPICSPPAPA